MKVGCIEVRTRIGARFFVSAETRCRRKARSAARFKRPTKAFEDALVGGRQAILSLPGAIQLEGGIPLLIDGKIVGAIGVSGATSQQDGVCAQAGADTLGKSPAAPPAKPAAPPKK